MIRRKRLALTAILVMLSTVIMLSMAIPAVEFNEAGQRVRFTLGSDESEDEVVVEAEDDTESSSIMSSGIQIFMTGLSWVLLPVSILYAIFTKDGRENLVSSLLRGAFYGIVVIVAIRIALWLDGFMGDMGSSTGAPTFFVGDIPPAVLIGVSGSLSLLIAAFVWLLFYRARHIFQPRQSIVNTAQTAIASLDAGIELRSVIIHCYADMLESVQAARGVKHEAHVTPREFSSTLQEIGISPRDVAQLTRLFEQVRYGGKGVTDREREVARDCLQAIVDDCNAQSAPLKGTLA